MINLDPHFLQICILQNYSSFEKCLKELFNLNRNQLKKYGLTLKELKKPIYKNDHLSVSLNILYHNQINPKYIGPNIKILEETPNYLILEKPSKIHLHPFNYLDQTSILSFISQKIKNGKDLLQININKYERGFLYRLDYETSGVIIYIKEETLFFTLRNNFSQFVQKKKYLAIIHGYLKDQTITHYLKGFGPQNKLMMAYEENTEDTQKAEINITSLEYNKKTDLSLVLIELKQGLRHQIRAQLAKINHPILGDPLYGKKTDNQEHMFLHCFKYTINYDGIHEFKSLPKSFERFFDLNIFLQKI